MPTQLEESFAALEVKHRKLTEALTTALELVRAQEDKIVALSGSLEALVQVLAKSNSSVTDQHTQAAATMIRERIQNNAAARAQIDSAIQKLK